ncbi:MAG: hypothetical protein OHK0052_26370 [Anaerolineales bacterium]
MPAKSKATLKQLVKDQPANIPFGEALEALLNTDESLKARYLYRLSDLSSEDSAALRQRWAQIALWRRQALMDDLQNLAEADLLLSFEQVARIALEDENTAVRFGALQVLTAQESDSPSLMRLYLNSMENDPEISVRALAASALGLFVYNAELDKLSPAAKADLETRLLRAAQEAHADVARRALESLGYSSHPQVPALIEQAYRRREIEWQASALFAMGRSADEVWQPTIMACLNAPQSVLRAESARAAGEIGIKQARAALFQLSRDPDEDVAFAALWALSQIGGSGVNKLLRKHLARARSDDEIQFFEDALDNLAFLEGDEAFGMLNLAEETADIVPESALLPEDDPETAEDFALEEFDTDDFEQDDDFDEDDFEDDDFEDEDFEDEDFEDDFLDDDDFDEENS